MLLNFKDNLSPLHTKLKTVGRNAGLSTFNCSVGAINMCLIIKYSINVFLLLLFKWIPIEIT